MRGVRRRPARQFGRAPQITTGSRTRHTSRRKRETRLRERPRYGFSNRRWTDCDQAHASRRRLYHHVNAFTTGTEGGALRRRARIEKPPFDAPCKRRPARATIALPTAAAVVNPRVLLSRRVRRRRRRPAALAQRVLHLRAVRLGRGASDSWPVCDLAFAGRAVKRRIPRLRELAPIDRGQRCRQHANVEFLRHHGCIVAPAGDAGVNAT